MKIRSFISLFALFILLAFSTTGLTFSELKNATSYCIPFDNSSFDDIYSTPNSYLPHQNGTGITVADEEDCMHFNCLNLNGSGKLSYWTAVYLGTNYHGAYYSFGYSNTYAVSFWMKMNDPYTRGTEYLWSYYVLGGSPDKYLSFLKLSNGNLRFQHGNGGLPAWTIDSDLSSVNLSEWNYITFYWNDTDGSNNHTRIIVNGVDRTTTSTTDIGEYGVFDGSKRTYWNIGSGRYESIYAPASAKFDEFLFLSRGDASPELDTYQDLADLYNLSQTYDCYDITETQSPCVANWSCAGYGSCNTSDLAPCDTVVDLGACGYNYTGDYSEFTPQSCNYCDDNVTLEATSLCDSVTDTLVESYLDNNFGTCCNVTGIATDCYNDQVQNTSVYEILQPCSIFDYEEEDIAEASVNTIAKSFITLYIFLTLIILAGFLAWGLKLFK